MHCISQAPLSWGTEGELSLALSFISQTPLSWRAEGEQCVHVYVSMCEHLIQSQQLYDSCWTELLDPGIPLWATSQDSVFMVTGWHLHLVVCSHFKDHQEK